MGAEFKRQFIHNFIQLICRQPILSNLQCLEVALSNGTVIVDLFTCSGWAMTGDVYLGISPTVVDNLLHRDHCVFEVYLISDTGKRQCHA